MALSAQLMASMDDDHLVTALHAELDPLTSTAAEQELLTRFEALLDEKDDELQQAVNNHDLTAECINKLGDALIVNADRTAKLLEVIGDEGYDDPAVLKADLELLSKFRAIANDLGENAARLFNLITTAQEA